VSSLVLEAQQTELKFYVWVLTLATSTGESRKHDAEGRVVDGRQGRRHTLHWIVNFVEMWCCWVDVADGGLFVGRRI